MYSVEKPSSLMLPRSPPEPFTHSTSTAAPLSGSVMPILAEVLPPPKLVMRRSEPSRLERYSSRSGSLMAAARASSHNEVMGCLVLFAAVITISVISMVNAFFYR